MIRWRSVRRKTLAKTGCYLNLTKLFVTLPARRLTFGDTGASEAIRRIRVWCKREPARASGL